MYDNIYVLKSDIPDVASVRLNDEGKELVWELIKICNPKNLSILFLAGLKSLLEKEQSKP
jgi:hypothetical protein